MSAVVSIHLQERDGDTQPCLSVELLGGPKPYLRIWLDHPDNRPEWGWTLGPTNRQLWPPPLNEPGEEPDTDDT